MPLLTIMMPLGAKSSASPKDVPWDGIAVAVFLDRDLLAKAKSLHDLDICASFTWHTTCSFGHGRESD
jgi:hypothetical protein